MSQATFPWHARPGLAGGIDKDGTRAAELLGLGFGSVEFGTVAVGPRAGAELAALRARLAALPPRAPGATANLSVPPPSSPSERGLPSEPIVHSSATRSAGSSIVPTKVTVPVRRSTGPHERNSQTFSMMIRLTLSSVSHVMMCHGSERC